MLLKRLKKAILNPFSGILYLFGLTKCYSQLGEDIIIDWLMLKDNLERNKGIEKKYKGFYVDIGANHPINCSNTYLFYKKGWRGINIEPNKKLIKRFNRKRSKDINLQIAAGKSNKNLTFYSFDADPLSTCDIETVKRYEKIGYKVIDKYIVPVWTLEKIFDTYVKDKNIDILSIDIEGGDMDALESNNREKYRPTYIILETVEAHKDGRTKQSHIFDPYLKSKGYGIIAETGANTIYKKTN